MKTATASDNNANPCLDDLKHVFYAAVSDGGRRG